MLSMIHIYVQKYRVLKNSMGYFHGKFVLRTYWKNFFKKIPFLIIKNPLLLNKKCNFKRVFKSGICRKIWPKSSFFTEKLLYEYIDFANPTVERKCTLGVVKKSKNNAAQGVNAEMVSVLDCNQVRRGHP